VKKQHSPCLTRRREDAKNRKDKTPQAQAKQLTPRLTHQPTTTTAAPHFAASRLRVNKNNTLLASREDAKNRNDSTPQTYATQHTLRLTRQPPTTLPPFTSRLRGFA
jgi:hypothetical protein